MHAKYLKTLWICGNDAVMHHADHRDGFFLSGGREHRNVERHSGKHGTHLYVEKGAEHGCLGKPF